MLSLFLFLVIAFVGLLIYRRNDHDRERIVKFLISFWSYQEMRLMAAACFAIYFASLVFAPSNTPSTSSFPSSLRVEHHHDFSGNKYSPINIQLSDPGYPIRFEVREK